MNVRSIWLVILNTIQKEWRSKALIFLFFITVLATIISASLLSFFKSNILTEVPMEGLAENSLRIYFWVINLWSFLVATFVGVSTVRSDLEGNVMSQMLSFPISRYEYLVGRIKGAYFIVSGYYFVSLIMGVISTSFVMGDFVVKPSLILGAIITSLSNGVVLTTAIFFGLYFSKVQAFILNIFFTGFVVMANGYFAGVSYEKAFEEMGVFTGICMILNTLIPRFSLLGDLGKSFIMDFEFKYNYGVEIPHFLVTYFLLFIVIYFIFKKKQI